VAKPVHERGDEVVRRLCGKVLSEPVDREPLAEAVSCGFLFQVEVLALASPSGAFSFWCPWNRALRWSCLGRW
jgi:hypothetical protein